MEATCTAFSAAGDLCTAWHYEVPQVDVGSLLVVFLVSYGVGSLMKILRKTAE